MRLLMPGRAQAEAAGVGGWGYNGCPSADETGAKGKDHRDKGRGSTNKRIVDMGVEPGTMIEVERMAPLGDPVDVKVKGYHLSLRRDEATGITVEVQ